eukprot:gene8435-5913_t
MSVLETFLRGGRPCQCVEDWRKFSGCYARWRWLAYFPRQWAHDIRGNQLSAPAAHFLMGEAAGGEWHLLLVQASLDGVKMLETELLEMVQQFLQETPVGLLPSQLDVVAVVEGDTHTALHLFDPRRWRACWERLRLRDAAPSTLEQHVSIGCVVNGSVLLLEGLSAACDPAEITESAKGCFSWAQSNCRFEALHDASYPDPVPAAPLLDALLDLNPLLYRGMFTTVEGPSATSGASREKAGAKSRFARLLENKEAAHQTLKRQVGECTTFSVHVGGPDAPAYHVLLWQKPILGKVPVDLENIDPGPLTPQPLSCQLHIYRDRGEPLYLQDYIRDVSSTLDFCFDDYLHEDGEVFVQLAPVEGVPFRTLDAFLPFVRRYPERFPEDPFLEGSCVGFVFPRVLRRTPTGKTTKLNPMTKTRAGVAQAPPTEEDVAVAVAALRTLSQHVRPCTDADAAAGPSMSSSPPPRRYYLSGLCVVEDTARSLWDDGGLRRAKRGVKTAPRTAVSRESATGCREAPLQKETEDLRRELGVARDSVADLTARIRQLKKEGAAAAKALLEAEARSKRDAAALLLMQRQKDYMERQLEEARHGTGDAASRLREMRRENSAVRKELSEAQEVVKRDALYETAIVSKLEREKFMLQKQLADLRQTTGDHTSRLREVELENESLRKILADTQRAASNAEHRFIAERELLERQKKALEKQSKQEHKELAAAHKALADAETQAKCIAAVAEKKALKEQLAAVEKELFDTKKSLEDVQQLLPTRSRSRSRTGAEDVCRAASSTATVQHQETGYSAVSQSLSTPQNALVELATFVKQYAPQLAAYRPEERLLHTPQSVHLAAHDADPTRWKDSNEAVSSTSVEDGLGVSSSTAVALTYLGSGAVPSLRVAVASEKSPGHQIKDSARSEDLYACEQGNHDAAFVCGPSSSPASEGELCRDTDDRPPPCLKGEVEALLATLQHLRAETDERVSAMKAQLRAKDALILHLQQQFDRLLQTIWKFIINSLPKTSFSFICLLRYALARIQLLQQAKHLRKMTAFAQQQQTNINVKNKIKITHFFPLQLKEESMPTAVSQINLNSKLRTPSSPPLSPLFRCIFFGCNKNSFPPSFIFRIPLSS